MKSTLKCKGIFGEQELSRSPERPRIARSSEASLKTVWGHDQGRIAITRQGWWQSIREAVSGVTTPSGSSYPVGKAHIVKFP
jgi:hypothetical protein